MKMSLHAKPLVKRNRQSIFIHTSDSFREVQAREVFLLPAPFRFFVHRALGKAGWRVTEYYSGRSINGTAPTMYTAIAKAKEKLEETKDQLADNILRRIEESGRQANGEPFVKTGEEVAVVVHRRNRL